MFIWPELDSWLSIVVDTSVASVELPAKVSSLVLSVPLSEFESAPELSGPPQQTSEHKFWIHWTLYFNNLQVRGAPVLSR